MEYNKIPINPCLHCGGKGIIKGRKKMQVVCSNCGAQGPDQPLRSQAIAAWNRDNLIRCHACKFYNETLRLCEIQKSKFMCYEPDDYCSKSIRKENKD